MARFQSRLFNWIDQSLPAQLGRKARQWYENSQMSQSIGKQTAKVILYPVYVFAKASERINPQLKSSPKVQFLLRPIQALVIWIGNSSLFARASKTVKPKHQRSRKTSFKALSATKSGELNHGLYDQQLANFHKLIKNAIAYFFGKKPTINRLKSSKSSQIQKSNSPWLDLFDDDMSPWPIIRGNQNPSLVNPKSNLVNTNSNSNLTSVNLSSEHDIKSQESSEPIRAWLDTQATFLGYAYSPVMQLIHWLDRLIASIERWSIQIFLWLWQLIKKVWFSN